MPDREDERPGDRKLAGYKGEMMDPEMVRLRVEFDDEPPKMEITSAIEKVLLGMGVKAFSIGSEPVDPGDPLPDYKGR